MYYMQSYRLRLHIEICPKKFWGRLEVTKVHSEKEKLFFKEKGSIGSKFISSKFSASGETGETKGEDFYCSQVPL